jgi:alkanesulfonate monooxygenase SsuD/methylene tetrahydromethanopterin reductase-like flavin-dependent oxidoreductase (luciferase family)
VIEVGVSVHDSLMVPDPDARRRLLDAVTAAGLDHVTLGDHISFHGGTGFDGLVAATSVLSTHDTLRVLLGVYQLALRHPLVTARQLASLSQIAPGRLTLGVGVGGEDRSEISNCGVDPATRGRRLDESLGLLRRLATGEAVDHGGEFFALEAAAVLPPPDPVVPLVIGGAGDAAVRRTAELGDGWLGIFCTARRFAETRTRILDAAAERDRTPDWFGVSVWCGLDQDPVLARSRLGSEMQALYRLPPEKFGHLTAAGTPEQVAEFLAPYVEGGAGNVSIIPVAGSPVEGVAAAGEVRRLLLAGSR